MSTSTYKRLGRPPQCLACQKTEPSNAKLMEISSNNMACTDFQRISDLFTKYTHLELDDIASIPKQICQECYKILADFHEFRKMCVTSYRDFLKRANAPMDSEEASIEQPSAGQASAGQASTEQASIEQPSTEQASAGQALPSLSSNEEEITVKHEDPIELFDLVMLKVEEFPEYDDNQELNDTNDSAGTDFLDINDECEEMDQASELEEFYCHHCPEVFEYKAVLLRHCNSKHPSKQYECGFCDHIYNNHNGLLSHLRRTHSLLKAQQGYTCMHCKKKYKSTMEMKNHMETHIDLLLECPYCVYQSISRPNFEIHLKSHTKCTKYICEFCEKVFYIYYSLRSHIRHVHSANKRQNSYACVHCKQQFLDAKEMKVHTDSVHPTKAMDKNDVPSKDCAKVSEETLLVLQHCDDKHPPNDQYECGLCDRIYNNSHGLQSHLRRSHLVLKAQQKYTCMICKQVYTNTVEMMSHIAMHGDTHLTCPHCDYETKIRENFEAHLNSHTKKIKYICEFCKKVSYTHHAFRSHIRKKHSANKRRSSYTCVHCKHQFLTVEEMKKHTDNEHSEKEKEPKKWFRCQHCSKVFKDQARLSKHCEAKHSSDIQGDCPFCDRIYKNNLSLSSHLRRTHSVIRGYERFKCLRCGELCPTALEMQEHFGIHADLILKCSHCEYKTESRERFEIHVNNHAKENEHICVLCAYVCDTYDKLQSHIQQMHADQTLATNTMEKPVVCETVTNEATSSTSNKHKCELCGAVYSNNFSLRTHYRRIHGVEKGLNTYTCSYCKKKYSQALEMEDHLVKTNHGDSRLKCTECEFRTKLPEQLEIHRNNHVKENKCICVQCKHNCDTYDSLQSHILQMHGDQESQMNSIEMNEEHMDHDITTIEGNDNTSSASNGNKCPFCSSAYNKHSSMVAHCRRMHSVFKSLDGYKCLYCKKKYSTAKEMKRHLVQTNHGGIETD